MNKKPRMTRAHYTFLAQFINEYAVDQNLSPSDHLIGELASFDENSEYGPLHPLSYLFTCQVEGNLIS